MKMLNQSNIIQIEITEHCTHKCSHCTRATNIIKSPKHHSLEYIEKSLQALSNWKGIVGCFGGEPTIHPKFEKICQLFKRYPSKSRSGLWTGQDLSKHRLKKLINETFGTICMNNDKERSYHQPPFISISDMITNDVDRQHLINNCWIHHLWSPIVTPKGIFFCEVAATIAKLHKIDCGASIEAGWKENSLLEKQKELCQKCGMALPTPRYQALGKNNYISSQNFNLSEDIDFNNTICIQELSDLPPSGVTLPKWKIERFLPRGPYFKSPLSQKIIFYWNKAHFLTKQGLSFWFKSIK